MGIINRISEIVSVQGVEKTESEMRIALKPQATFQSRMAEELGWAEETLERVRKIAQNPADRTLFGLASSVMDEIRALDARRAQAHANDRARDVDRIQRVVCRYFKIPAGGVMGDERFKSLAYARHITMFLCRKRLALSLPELGRAFGRDHTTILSAVRRIEALAERDAQTRKHLEALEQMLDAPAGSSSP